jgi:hypothetical protein
MKRIALLQLDDSEVAVVALSNNEHNALHRDREKFVNQNHIFGAEVIVRTVKFESDVPSAAPAPTATVATATWTSTIRHWPGCNCTAACVSDVQKAA